MKRLLFYGDLYISMISQYIKIKMQFRTDFYISTVAMLLMNVCGIFSYWILFHSITGIAQWSLWELIFFYAFALLAVTPQQLFFDNIWVIRFQIRSGSFIKYYLKPINILFYYISEVLDLKGFGQLFFALFMFVYSSMKLGIQWHVGNLLLLLVLLASSAVIMISLVLMTCSVAFWVVDSIQLPMLIFKLADYSKYPLSMFNGFFRFFFTAILPIGFLSYYPARVFLRPGESHLFVYFTPVVALVVALIAYGVWSKGVNSYSGTGS